MEYPALVFLHVLSGALWAGSAVLIGFFLVPAVLDAGPAGGAVMGAITKRRLPTFMTVVSAFVILTGVRLYMLRFTSGWMTTPEGLVITAGAFLAIIAFVMGLTIQKPTAQRLGMLAARIAASGAPPTAAETSEMQVLRSRLRSGGAGTAWLLAASAALMAVHRLAQTL